MWKQKRQSPKYIILSQSCFKNQASVPILQSYNSPKHIQQQNHDSRLSKHAYSRGIPLHLEKDMQSIKAELNQCMINLNYEQKRNNLLKNLIAVHQGQMKEIMEDQKRGQEVQMQANAKMARKIEYDIEQILQKHNEQIAKINSLKQQSASARTDRVVFSNLFKKIQKEIKQHQDLYKETIIRTEIMRQSKEIEARYNKPTLDSANDIDPKEENNNLHNITKSHNNHREQASSRIFLTNPVDRSSVLRSNLKKVSEKYQNSREDSDLLKLQRNIDQLQTNIQKVLKVVECGSFEQAYTYYCSLQLDNSELIQRINQDDKRMDAIQTQIQRLKNERSVSQILEGRQLNKLETMPSIRKVRSNRLIKTLTTQENQTETRATDQQIFSEVTKLLSISTEADHQADNITDQFLNELETKISHLSCSTQNRQHYSSESGCIINSECLESILCKMERYDTCERILNKKQFESEYIRELSKTKKLPRVKKSP